MTLAGAPDRLEGGDLLVDIAEMPVNGAVAPLEFVCRVDEHLTQRGIRLRARLSLLTPSSGPATKPLCKGTLAAKGVQVVANAPLAVVTDQDLACPDARTVSSDQLVTIPPQEGPALIEYAGLGDGPGFGLTGKLTLKSRKAGREFLLGDNTRVPTSKAGSAAHAQAEVAVRKLLRGSPGRSPLPVSCPLTLLEGTRLNHPGKLAFKSICWHRCCPAGRSPWRARR